MALTLAQLQAQRDEILSEMGGAQAVTFGDKSVTRRPQQDLDAALARVDAEIASLSPQSRQFKIQTSRGL
jgi:5-enolpyruvylshikimate-3-phosphate synthase